MKKKHVITVANSEIHIITDEPKESIDTVVGVVNRRMREILLHSKGISRIDASLLLSLECMAEKLKIQKQLREKEAENERLVALGESKDREIASLERELETLRASLSLANAHNKPQQKKAHSAQLGFDEMDGEDSATPGAKDGAVEEILSGAEQDKNEAPAKKNRRGRRAGAKGDKPAKVRSMFDLISYDDI